MFYYGYLWRSFLGIILMQLFFNYLLTQRNINVGLYFIPRRDVQVPHFELSGVNLIFDVARRAHLLLEFFADFMEKLNNLFMWKRPDTTKKFCVFIGFFFTMSLLCSTSTCFFIIGLIVGLKTFITAYLYHRFPRLRNKLDLFSYFFYRVPTDFEKLHRRRTTSHTDVTKASQNTVTASQFETCSLRNFNIMSSVVETAMLKTRTRSISAGDDRAASGECVEQRNFTKPTDSNTQNSISIKDLQCPSMKFSCSQSVEEEAPQIECIMKRSCVLIDKNKSLAKRLASGTLLLTETEMLFRYNQNNTDENKIIYMPFDEMQKVTKIHLLTPLSRRSIEVFLETRRRPLQFVGISKRDEFVDAVLKAAANAGTKLRS
ncbi:unnamed protein product [Toxocara canis]|nr:unnamed protein product [Toxocara canis]